MVSIFIFRCELADFNFMGLLGAFLDLGEAEVEDAIFEFGGDVGGVDLIGELIGAPEFIAEGVLALGFSMDEEFLFFGGDGDFVLGKSGDIEAETVGFF